MRKRRVAGVVVAGTLDEAAQVIAQTTPDEVIVTIADAPAERLALVLAACEEAGLECRVMRRRTQSGAQALAEAQLR